MSRVAVNPGCDVTSKALKVVGRNGETKGKESEKNWKREFKKTEKNERKRDEQNKKNA